MHSNEGMHSVEVWQTAAQCHAEQVPAGDAPSAYTCHVICAKTPTMEPCGARWRPCNSTWLSLHVPNTHDNDLASPSCAGDRAAVMEFHIKYCVCLQNCAMLAEMEHHECLPSTCLARLHTRHANRTRRSVRHLLGALAYPTTSVEAGCLRLPPCLAQQWPHYQAAAKHF